jgi:hypothetical protein
LGQQHLHASLGVGAEARVKELAANPLGFWLLIYLKIFPQIPLCSLSLFNLIFINGILYKVGGFFIKSGK